MRTLSDASNVDMINGRLKESIEKTVRAIELTRQVDNPYAELLARYTAVSDYLLLGDPAVSRLHASAMRGPAEKLRDRFWLTLALRVDEDVAHAVARENRLGEKLERGHAQAAGARAREDEELKERVCGQGRVPRGDDG